MESTTKNGKNEMRQILGDGRKWKNETNYGGRREYYIHEIHYLTQYLHQFCW